MAFARFRCRPEFKQPMVVGVQSLNYGRPNNPDWRPFNTYRYTPFSGQCDVIDSCWDQTNPGPPYRHGGVFTSYHYDAAMPLLRLSTLYNNLEKYDGGFYIPNALVLAEQDQKNLVKGSKTTEGQYSVKSLEDITSYNATAWNKFKPGKPQADAFVFLAELRDVPRTLQGTAEFFHNMWRAAGGDLRIFGPKKVADAWLTHQFGWLPFLNDLRKFYKTYKNVDESLKRIRRQNGQWIKRGGVVATVTDNVVLADNRSIGLSPVLTTGYYVNRSGYGTTRVSLRYKRHVWFEGAFRYWIPDNMDSPIWKASAVSHLFGLTPNPSVIWSATPWSWLVDWGSNVGDNLANLTTGYADNLAAKYAYIMGTTSYQKVTDTETFFKQCGNQKFSLTENIQVKTRGAASPFGFGLSESNFTSRQWSILSALGVTRSG